MTSKHSLDIIHQFIAILRLHLRMSTSCHSELNQVKYHTILHSSRMALGDLFRTFLFDVEFLFKKGIF